MNCYIILPYLKTSKPITIGKCQFHEIHDLSDIKEEDAIHIKKIQRMFYLKHNQRIVSFTYCVLPIVDLMRKVPDIEYLQKIQSCIAYFYSSPQIPDGSIFTSFDPISSECASMYIFVPDIIDEGLVYISGNISVNRKEVFPQNKRKDGYMVLNNFNNYIYVSEKTKLYPTSENILLYYGQDLFKELSFLYENTNKSYQLLIKIIEREQTSTSNKYFVSLKWYSLATKSSADISYSIVCLSIAFESLLGLPNDEKTSRIIDSISMLLGRPERLDEWTRQFYSIRSAIVHEGITEKPYFIVPGGKKNEPKYYGHVFHNGLLIYRLCLRTLIQGYDLSYEFRVNDLFITNQERLESIIVIANQQDSSDEEKINKIADLISIISDNSYVPENNLTYALLLSALDCFLKLISSTPVFNKDFWKIANELTAINGKNIELDKIEKLRGLSTFIKANHEGSISKNEKACKDFISYILRMTAYLYSELKRRSLTTASTG